MLLAIALAVQPISILQQPPPPAPLEITVAPTEDADCPYALTADAAWVLSAPPEHVTWGVGVPCSTDDVPFGWSPSPPGPDGNPHTLIIVTGEHASGRVETVGVEVVPLRQE